MNGELMKRLLLVAILLASPAWGATRYVGKTGGCAHMSGETCSSAADCGATFATACCELDLANASSSVSAGDTIEVHTGTYADTDTSANNTCYSGSLHALRITKANTIWQEASGETATVDLAATRHGGIYVAADGVTVDGFTISGQLTTGNDPDRCASIGGDGVPSNVTIKNNTITWVGDGTDVCSSCSVGLRMDFDGASVIENNTITGPYAFSTWLLLVTVSVTTNSHIIIRNNTITNTRVTANRGNGMTIEGPEGTGVVISIYGNNIQKTNGDSGTSNGFYFRDHVITLYAYNNYLSGFNNGILLQDDQDVQVEQAYIFNNTMEDCVYGLRWPEAYHADVRNNYFECSSSGVRYDSCNPANCNATLCGDTNCATCDRCDTMDQVNANDTFKYNVLANAEKVNAANCPGTCPEPTTSNNTVGTCTLDGSFKITNSGNCYNTGFNSPVDQGANTCSVGGVSCLVDFEGNARPQVTEWDIGWDEYTAGGGGGARRVVIFQ